jgi:hypothetical protein
MAAHDEIRTQEHLVSSDAALGFPDLHKRMEEAWFRDDVLLPNPDSTGPVPTRYRIKAMCVYRRGEGDDITLEPHPVARIGAGSAARDVPWFDYFGLEGVPEFTKAILNLVPPERWHPAGTFGVHAFRSFSQVTTGPHQDGFEYGITFVVDHVGGGAEAYLQPLAGTSGFHRRLEPGEFILYRDACFMHGCTSLQGQSPHRDALVIQFEAPEDLEVAGL